MTKVVHNPPNRFEHIARERLEPPEEVRYRVIYEDDTKSILSRNDSPDLPFRWSCNPYRGCFHACVYCYARPTHEFWGFGAGTDFESSIIAKRNAADLLRKTFLHPSWNGDLILFSGNTDAYQPVEETLRLTRACLDVCAEFRNPVSIITKSSLIVRDLDILTRLQSEATVTVFFSIPFIAASTARKVEPHVPSPGKRFEVMKAVVGAGIRAGISIAPIIPGLNDEDIPKLLSRAKESGASMAVGCPLRLPGSVEPYFLDQMAMQFPDRIKKITNRIREIRDGKMSESQFFDRQTGQGPYWEIINRLFTVHRRRTGLQVRVDGPIRNTFRRPVTERSPRQQELF